MDYYLPNESFYQIAGDRYGELGHMLLLDLQRPNNQSDRSIGEYYNTLSSHICNQTKLIVFEKTDRLISYADAVAYATWETLSDGTPEVRITCQCAPYGHHLQLQQTLRDHLPENVRVISLHEDSARVEQPAW